MLSDGPSNPLVCTLHQSDAVSTLGESGAQKLPTPAGSRVRPSPTQPQPAPHTGAYPHKGGDNSYTVTGVRRGHNGANLCTTSTNQFKLDPGHLTAGPYYGTGQGARFQIAVSITNEEAMLISKTENEKHPRCSVSRVSMATAS